MGQGLGRTAALPSDAAPRAARGFGCGCPGQAARGRAGGGRGGWGHADCLLSDSPHLHTPPICLCTAYALQVLTINIHLSPLDYCGCLPSENGLVLHDLDLTVAHLL